MKIPENPTKIEYGTPPTPDNPYPSNQIVRHYGDSLLIMTPPPDEQVLAEYEQAIANFPEDEGLRLRYAESLRRSGAMSAGLDQARVAVSISPGSSDAHLYVALFLNDQGDYAQALAEFEESLRLVPSHKTVGDQQSEAITRKAMAETLQNVGRVEEARAELKKAVEIEKGLVSRGCGSMQFLRQVKQAPKECA